MAKKRKLTDRDYERLLEFRTGLRRFLHWSKSQAAKVSLSPSLHQLLLAIRGHRDPRGPTISNVAAYLMLKHHSAVELIDRAEIAGLVERVKDPSDKGRVTRLRCTKDGLDKLESLTIATLEELQRASREPKGMWEGLDP